MNEPTQQTTAAAPAEPTISDGADALDQRADALIASLKTDAKEAAKAEPEADTSTDEASTEAAAEAKPVEQASPTKTQEQINAERAERIAAMDAQVEAMAARERERVTASRAEKAPPPAPAAKTGPVVTDEETFFQAAESLGLTPQKLADWLQKQNDPAKAAEHHARKALTPLEQKVAELEAHQKALLDSIAARERAAQEAVIAQQNTQVLLQHLGTVADEAPLTSRLAEKQPHMFMEIVNGVCDSLPDGFTAQDVIDRIEVKLADFQLYEVPSPDSTTKRTKESAAAKANVGNRLAAERGTTVNQDEEDPGDLEDRARRLKARLAAAG